MRKLSINSSIGTSDILVGESLKNVKNYLPNKKIAIITDSNVRKLYQNDFPQGLVIEIGTGEGIKTLQTVENIIEQLIQNECDRSAFILGIGGGIVCDITGFVASIFMRGVSFGFVSTTLLSQVDASVGGKNGVNFGGLKNMIGVFNLPQFVICDMEMLKTLSPQEIECGFAEIVKHGAIKSNELFNYIETNAEKAKTLDAEVIEHFVYQSVVIKANVVNEDAREKGERRKLNFGHTFGHAIEKITQIPHGQAVSIGMVVAANLSVNRGILSPEKAQRLTSLLKLLGLPTQMSIDPQKALAAMKRDKKRDGDKLHFVLLSDLGNADVVEITFDELKTIVATVQEA